MYKVYLDGRILYHPNILDKFSLTQGKVSLELNKTGTFTFTIYQNNQRYNDIQKMKSVVQVYDDDYRLFRGRVLNTKRGFYNELQVTCEGELAFLLDSKQRPYDYQGTVEEYFRFLIERHNEIVDEEKRFKIGRVTVTDPNDYIVRANSNYPKTFDELKEKLIDTLGGYLWTREEVDGVYIDYLTDFEEMNTQKIKFGENLLDLEETVKGQDIATVIIPLGYKLQDSEGNETGERLTISDINDGVDYVYSKEAVERFGWIEKTVEYDNVTLAENLIRKGREELANSIHLIKTIDLSGVDMHALNLNIKAFRMGRYTFVESPPHQFEDYFLTRKMDIDLLNAANNHLSLGDERQTFVDKQVDSNKNVNIYVGKVEEDYKQLVGDTVKRIDNKTTSKIEQASNQIFLEINSTYYAKDDIENIVKELKTSIEQSEEKIQINISRLDKDLQDKFNTITKYFAFEVDGLIIGQVNNPYKVIIDNDRYSMTLNDVEVLWIDAVTGTVHTPEINATRRIKVLGYVEEMDDEGRINTRWGGED